MNQYRNIAERINYWLFLTVVALLPFPQFFLRIACVLWIFSWLFEGRWLNRPKPLKENTMAIPFLLFGIWYAWKALSGLWAADHAAWNWQMERYMTFGLMVPVGIWGVNERYDWRTIGKVLVISCIAAIPIYIAVLTLFFHHHEFVQYFQWEEEWNFWAKNWYSFAYDNISQLKHRLFLCSVECFGIIMAIQLWRKRLAILIPAILVMASTIPLTGSRQSVLTIVALVAVEILFSLSKRYRWRYGLGILVVGILSGIGLLKLHPRMQEVDFSDITEMRTISYEHDIRFNIWGSALQNPSDYIAYGIGAGQSKQYMKNQYERVGLEHYAFLQLHPHNQYLEETIELGLGGLIFFILIWLAIPLCAKGRGRQTALLLCILFMLNMLTDCMFGKFCGIALWATGMLLLLLQTQESTDD